MTKLPRVLQEDAELAFRQGLGEFTARSPTVLWSRPQVRHPHGEDPFRVPALDQRRQRQHGPGNQVALERQANTARRNVDDAGHVPGFFMALLSRVLALVVESLDVAKVTHSTAALVRQAFHGECVHRSLRLSHWRTYAENDTYSPSSPWECRSFEPVLELFFTEIARQLS